MRKSQKSHPCVLSADGFKQALQKYASRHAKGDVVFALLSLRLDSLATSLGETEVDAVSLVGDLLTQSCIGSLRQQDRICRAEDGLILFLLPDADADGALVAKERLSAMLQDFKTNHRGKELRASGSVNSAHCTQESCDIGSMLQQVGAPLDEHGYLGRRESGEVDADLAGVLVWGARYSGFVPDATSSSDSSADSVSARGCVAVSIDQWSGLPVRIERLSTSGWEKSQDDQIKRCRILQGIDHPALNRVLDFHDDRQHALLYLVWTTQGDANAATLVGDASLSRARALSWLDDIVSALSYLHGLVPSVVPDSLSLIDFCLSADGSKLILSPRLLRFIQNDGSSSHASELFADVANLFIHVGTKTASPGLPSEVMDLIAQLQLKKVPANLSSMHKVRAALRKIIERADSVVSVIEHA